MLRVVGLKDTGRAARSTSSSITDRVHDEPALLAVVALLFGCGAHDRGADPACERDDPEAVVHCAKIAIEYAAVQKPVVITCSVIAVRTQRER